MAKEIIKLKNYNDIRNRFSELTQEWNGIRKIIESPNGYIKFNASNKFQTYTIPSDVTKIHIYACGAKGAASNGGEGGIVECDMVVTPGQKLYIYCGQRPSSTQQASYNATDIRTNISGGVLNQTSLQSRILVAGGGGNGSNNHGGCNGGGKKALELQNTYLDNDLYSPTGGTQVEGGKRGGNWGASKHGTLGVAGTFGLGGNAGNPEAGAGGAGWYGGGGGGDHRGNDCGGGGGSSYADTSIFTNIKHYQGGNKGAGYLIISKPSNSSGSIPKAYRDRQYLTSTSNYNGYVKTSVPVETKKIHTLGNENNIRRSFNNAYEQIYNTLKYSNTISKNSCYLIGEETSEETTAKPFSNEVLENEPYNLSEVKKTQTSWCTSRDDYIVTYDINTKRKLDLNTVSLNTVSNNVYIPFAYNDDIIYIKDKIVNGANDVYKRVNKQYVKQSSQGNYLTPSERTLLDTTTPGTKTFSSSIGGSITAILVGAGGGGGGGSYGDRWKTTGAGGGSGGYIKTKISFDHGTIKVQVGAGGAGGSVARKGGGHGGNGTNTILYINNIQVVKAGAGGGGGGSMKKNNYPPFPGAGAAGSNSYVDDEANFQVNVLENKNGKQGYNTSGWGGGNAGGPSVYGNNYGAGGSSHQKQSGVAGQNGYAKITITENPYFEYNGHIYTEYQGSLSGSIVFEEDYKYLINRLDALENMFKSYRKKNWFDSTGYCQTSCQTTCQIPSQKS